MINVKTTERNGDVVSIIQVVDDDELMIISQGGILIRQPIRDISSIGRNTQGVKLINLEAGDRVFGVARIVRGNGGAAPEGGTDREAEDGGGLSDSDGNGRKGTR